MKYCDDVNCPNLNPNNTGNGENGNCDLGFINRFRIPSSYQDINDRNWGYVMPKLCQQKYYKKKEQSNLKPVSLEALK